MPPRACFAVPGRVEEAYFFSGAKYVRIGWRPYRNDDTIISGPRKITDGWLSLKKAGFNTVDAVLPSPVGGGTTYFFRGSRFVKVGVNPTTLEDTIIFGPENIANHWTSLADAGFDTVDTVIQSPVSNELYFFSGTRFVRIRLSISANETIDDNIIFGPADIFAHWQTFQTTGFDTLDTALSNPLDSTLVYLFSGAKYVRVNLTPGANIFDIPSNHVPSNVATGWPSLAEAGFY